MSAALANAPIKNWEQASYEDRAEPWCCQTHQTFPVRNEHWKFILLTIVDGLTDHTSLAGYILMQFSIYYIYKHQEAILGQCLFMYGCYRPSMWGIARQPRHRLNVKFHRILYDWESSTVDIPAYEHKLFRDGVYGGKSVVIYCNFCFTIQRSTSRTFLP